ncbi:hypothetical protein HME9304_02776 [Flagellimonas maritima]|uniref:Gliding motility-associated C-terminal domain-containing protein n=1 Tax=Flagellimonas maritima TaxID=1383885 RepID=A0A2Z4LWU0_9FLAO|nr:gliding motility-associated C-terminal domain-containing protein [Allomuricauda aurantiaca]AWX45747.1 hypothetical protein HME9304_02776 [Allomuricauda aurantiaca]
MDQLRIYITGLFLLGLHAAQAQVTNTGEITVVSDTQISSVSDFQNTATGSVNNNGELFLYADYDNGGSFTYLTATGGTVRFQGTSLQQLSGNGTNSFYSAVFDNPTGPIAFELAAAINVANNADFVQGIAKNDGFGGSIQFGPAAGYTNSSNSSYVDGAVQKEGNSAFTFPVGDGGFHRTAAISASDNANAIFASRYILENSNTVYPHNVFLGNVGFIDDMEYWTLDRVQGTSDVGLTLRWDAATTPTELLTADSSEIHIVRWDTAQGAWVDEGGIVNEGNQTVATTAMITGYGVFTLAKVSTDETDTDGDGVPDFAENNAMPPTDPNNPNDYIDTDGDGVPDYVENNTAPGSDPNDENDFMDGDGDGIPDYIEEFGVDTDGDGVPDYIELTDDPATDPNDPNDFTDNDGDGVPDYVETNGDPETDPDDPADFMDTDGDGVPDYIEINGDPSSDPNDPTDFVDTDGDGVPDYVETEGDPATNPNNPTDFADGDGDGVPDYVETEGDPSSNPNDPNDFVDTDGDGVPDYTEINGNPATDPNDSTDFVDTDGDGVPDYVEINGEPSSDPNDPTDFADGDGDGISDYTEGGYIQDDIFIENDLVSKSQPSGFFEIVNIERFPDNTVEIFNRNGIKVFSINGYDNNSRVFRGISDGRATLQNGEGLPTGVYFYIIKYIQEGNGRTRSGYLYIQQ